MTLFTFLVTFEQKQRKHLYSYCFTKHFIRSGVNTTLSISDQHRKLQYIYIKLLQKLIYVTIHYRSIMHICKYRMKIVQFYTNAYIIVYPLKIRGNEISLLKTMLKTEFLILLVFNLLFTYIFTDLFTTSKVKSH